MGSGKKKRELKTRQEELRQPDEFVTFWTRAATEVQKRVVPISVGIGVAILAGGISWATTAMSESKREAASAKLSRALQIASAPLKVEAGKDDAAADLLAKLSGDATPDVPRFPTAQEKHEAALKEIDALLAEQGGVRTARQARLTRAALLVRLGKFDEAIKVYDEYLALVGADASLAFLARQGRAVSLEGLGKLDEALAEYKQLESDPHSQARAKYQQARLLALKGDKKAARELYQGVLDKFPATSMREEIQGRLAALGE